MQIYALDAQKALLHARQAYKGRKYICPECKGEVRLRGGGLKQLHFYHLGSGSCRHQGKSLTHLSIQQALQEMLAPEKILIENYFSQIGRIADVAWPHQKLIFEVQVSPISADEIMQRNQDYSRIGYQVVWILHDRQFNRTQMTAAEGVLRRRTHYFTNINAFGKGIFYDQYSFIRFRRRVKRSRRFPVRFNRHTAVNNKQLPRHFPFERKKWPLSFEGDLFHRSFHFSNSAKKRNVWDFIAQFYRFLFHLLLEKSTL